jgi:XTP/dITP diphosphohydrolase
MNTPAQESFQRLITIMDELREKCPWDKKQTLESLRTLTIEETYELADAITNKDWKGIKEELGDILLHIIFYAKIGDEENAFTIDEMINGVCDKLIHRHPHIYGNVIANDEETVKQNWEKLKLKEGKTSVLAGVPKALPATVKAIRLQEKAKQVGFEWEEKAQVWDKVLEEMEELKEAEVIGEKSKIESEFGDLIFSLINYARFLQVDAETALEKTNLKFLNRFNAMEEKIKQQGKDISAMSLIELDAVWNSVKKDYPQ